MRFTRLLTCEALRRHLLIWICNTILRFLFTLFSVQLGSTYTYVT